MMFMRESKSDFIRPFVYIKESKIFINTAILGLPEKKTGSSMDGHTKQQGIKVCFMN